MLLRRSSPEWGIPQLARVWTALFIPQTEQRHLENDNKHLVQPQKLNILMTQVGRKHRADQSLIRDSPMLRCCKSGPSVFPRIYRPYVSVIRKYRFSNGSKKFLQVLNNRATRCHCRIASKPVLI